jgi:DNA-binding response OmpR family regulator
LSTSRPRILVVDDDDDLREVLALSLSQDGYDIRQAGGTEAALGALRQGGFDLLITDYELPDGTGAQLLRTAAGERLLRDCAVLVVTGHPEPEGVGAAPVISKPFDLDALRRQVRHIVERSAVPDAAASPSAPQGIDLVLYVTHGSPPSKIAERNLRQILERASGAAVHLEVRDVGQRPRDAERDRILFVPTLVVRCSPPVWVVGALRNPAALLGILALCCAGEPSSA